MTKTFEHISHNGEIKIRAYGDTQETLFENAMHGMFESIHPVINEKKPLTTRLLVCEGANLQELLESFLSDCLYLAATNHEIYRDIKILELSDSEIHASLTGTPILDINQKDMLDFTIKDVVLKHTKNAFEAAFSFKKIKNN